MTVFLFDASQIRAGQPKSSTQIEHPLHNELSTINGFGSVSPFFLLCFSEIIANLIGYFYSSAEENGCKNSGEAEKEYTKGISCLTLEWVQGMKPKNGRKNSSLESPAGKEIRGKISDAHGNKGLVRAIFEKGLPGQAINK
jgi:hypothetical protein